MKTTRIDNILARQKRSVRLDALMLVVMAYFVGFGISSFPYTM